MQHVVVGGAGFLGGHLVEHLIERGGQVRVIARRPERPAWLPAAAELAPGDLNDPEALARLCVGADLVYVTTTLPTPTPSEAAARTKLDCALRGLAAACARAGVGRMIYVSGVDVYGRNASPRPINEDYPTTPATPSGRLRLAAELTLRAAAAAYRLPLVVLRPAPIFGPRDHAFTRPLLDAYNAPPGPALIGGGRARLSLVYVKDVARALALAARHPAAVGRTYHVGGFATTWRAFIAAICSELQAPEPAVGLPYPLAYALGWCAERLAPTGREPRHSRDATTRLGRTRLYSDERLVGAVGYHPAYDLLAGVEETVAWYRGLNRTTPARSDPPRLARVVKPI
jgi:nucleoside-diphosphate-sugar epimerase